MTAVLNLLKKCGVAKKRLAKGTLTVVSPIDGEGLMSLRTDTTEALNLKIDQSERAFQSWQKVPAPKRGELIRLLGLELRAHHEILAQLVTLDCGKIIAEGRGEVQEMIDICEFAVGVSRQLYGLTIASERPDHRMQETWHPLGPVAVISAFNFPVAVWAWNFALAIVCGCSVLWKPSEKTPLTALACQGIFEKAVQKFDPKGDVCPPHLSQLVIGDRDVGAALVAGRKVALVSATGSSAMGQKVGAAVATRFGRSLLELGGNNALIVSEKADLKLAHDALVFGAVGTAGQRCTTTRRAFIHASIFERFSKKLIASYKVIAADKIGDPRDVTTLVGPLIDQGGFDGMQKALAAANAEGGKIHFGRRVLVSNKKNAYYVEPALVILSRQTPVVRTETFAPILYLIPYTHLGDAIDMQNDVSQGLSSAIFTTDVREAEYFRSRSDCGIANVNIGTSGAEIGGAFGGEKETGGGRESGSDAWKNYMRRQTSTLYFGHKPPALAQGLAFDVE